MFCSVDDELGPRLYCVDPAGATYGYIAVACGDKEAEAMSALEKMFKDDKKVNSKDLNSRETIESAIESLQKVLGVDFKSNEVEVGIVTKQDSRFRLLTQKEIEEYLTSISEKD